MVLTWTSPVLFFLITIVTATNSQPQTQSQFIPQAAPHPVGPIPQASIPVSAVISTQGAQSRDSPVYQQGAGQGSVSYQTGGQGSVAYQSGGQGVAYQGQVGQGSVSDYTGAYSQTAQGAAAPQLTTDAANNNGYYYYYYPVAQEKEPYSSAPATFHTTDTYGIDPWGVVAVLAVVGLLIAGLAFIFPSIGWANHQDVYYRAFKSAPEYLGLDNQDLTHLAFNVISAIEGRSCWDEFVCNSGKVMKKSRKADNFLRFLEYIVPNSYIQSIKILRTSIQKPEECKKINCSRSRQ